MIAGVAYVSVFIHISVSPNNFLGILWFSFCYAVSTDSFLVITLDGSFLKGLCSYLVCTFVGVITRPIDLK